MKEGREGDMGWRDIYKGWGEGRGDRFEQTLIYAFVGRLRAGWRADR